MNLDQEDQWLENFIQVPLQDEIRDRIKNFALLWNLFETFVCDKRANPTNIGLGIDVIHAYAPITNQFIDRYLAYFIDRYIDLNGAPNGRFTNLNFRSSEPKNEVLDVLQKRMTLPQEVLKALLYIVLRFRNNLFHGEKNVAHLNGQIDNFEMANNLLIDILDVMRTHYKVKQYNFPNPPLKRSWYQKILDRIKQIFS